MLLNLVNPKQGLFLKLFPTNCTDVLGRCSYQIVPFNKSFRMYLLMSVELSQWKLKEANFTSFNDPESSVIGLTTMQEAIENDRKNEKVKTYLTPMSATLIISFFLLISSTRSSIVLCRRAESLFLTGTRRRRSALHLMHLKL